MSMLPSTITNIDDHSDKVVKINDDGLYYYNIVLFNPDGDVVRIKQSAIKALVLEDTISNFYHEGYLIYENRFDVLESINAIANPGSDKNEYFAQNKNDSFVGYRFRGDCRDFLYIDIMPDVKGKGTSVQQGNFDEQDKRTFNLKFAFSIYNTEDVLGDSPELKYKKLYFHDTSYQIMNEKQVYFSTSDLIKNDQIILLNNQDRGAQTGIAIKELLKKTFTPDENYNIKFSDIWDEGGSSLFYSSPAQSKAIDDLQYLLDYHVSTVESNYDNCFLRIERYTDEWSLISYSDLFKRAYQSSSFLQNEGITGLGGPDMIETFYLAFPSDNSSPKDVETRIPEFQNNLVTFNNSSILDQYEFTTMSGMDSQNDIVSHLVHSHNFATHTFRIDFTNNNIEKAQEIYYQNYVQNMKGQNGKSPASNLTLNKYREQQKNIKNIFSVSSESQNQRFSFGRNQILKSSLFLNNCIKFKTKGNTIRQAGKFINIQRNNQVPNNPFDDKYLGIYLIVKCNHLFTDTTYNTEILAIKTYNFNDLKLTKEGL